MGLVKKISKTIGYTTLGLIGYSSALLGVEAYGNSKSTPVKTFGEAHQILQREKKKLGIEDKYIMIDWQNEDPVPAAGKLREGEYIIRLNKDNTKESDIKHEVYHIADEHVEDENMDGTWGIAKYFFYYEPQAALYEAFDIKL